MHRRSKWKISCTRYKISIRQELEHAICRNAYCFSCNAKPSPAVKIAKEILTNHFEEFSRKHYEKIMRKLNLSEEELREAINEITSLNPKPGSSWINSMEIAMSNITPDFIVESDNEGVIMYLNNQNIPDLKINREFLKWHKGTIRIKKACRPKTSKPCFS